MIQAGNKTSHLSAVNHSAKTINNHRLYHGLTPELNVKSYMKNCTKYKKIFYLYKTNLQHYFPAIVQHSIFFKGK